MKFNLCFATLMLFVLLASCNSNAVKRAADTTNTEHTPQNSHPANTASIPAGNMQYCFFYTEGTQAQDTTKVNIIINHNKVNGTMSWLPKEKDARKGKLVGTLHGNVISAVWYFNQEATADTMRVEFLLRGNELAQKPYKYDAKTGRQQTDEGAAYSMLYHMENCK